MESSNGPRPLATKPEYIRRSHTSKSGLLSSSTIHSATSSNTNNTPHELDHFSFKRPVNDSLLQPNAKRARKMYRSILRDQYYLLDLKQMWQTKLKKLKMEQMLLDQMCAYTQEDVNDTPPLFNHNDSMPLSNQQHQQQYQQRHSRFLQSHKEQEIRQLDQQDDSYSLDLWTPVSSVHPESSPSSPHSSVYVTADDVVSETNSVADSFYLPGLRSGMNSSSKKSPVSTTTIGFTRATPSSATTTTTAAAQISTTDNNVSNTLLEEYDDSDSNDTASNKEDFIGLADSGNDDSNGEDNGEEEDEETARRALTFMLARYGNDL